MEKEKGILKQVLNFINRIFWIFIIGSVFGFFAEMLYSTVYTRSIVIRHGLIYGPFVQVYGMGAVAYYLLITRVQKPKEAFFAGMFMGGILEYLCSFFQEILFGTISWDYSDMFININGRTSLLYCFYWGIIAVVFLNVVYPGMGKLEFFIHKKQIKILTIFLAIFMAFDISISCMAADRQKERHDGTPPQNRIDEFLDKAYPDELLNRIYNNKKEIT